MIFFISEAVVCRCSVEKVFLEISQNSQENTCVIVSFFKETLTQVFSCELFKISKNTFFYRTPLVATSVICHYRQESSRSAQCRRIKRESYEEFTRRVTDVVSAVPADVIDRAIASLPDKI